MADAGESDNILIRHVLLTGPPGVGKTTLIVKVCEILQLNSIPIQGFYTEEVLAKSGERLGFDVVTVDGNRGPLARVTAADTSGAHNYQREYKVGKYSVDLPSFTSLAIPALKPLVRPLQELSLPDYEPIFQDIPGQPDSVYIIDEIGKMELFSMDFVGAVSNVFSRDTAVTLSTIPLQKGRPIAVVDKIKARNDVKLIYVNRDNRDSLMKPIVETLAIAYQSING